MSKLMKIFKKQGGMKLLGQYWRGGALFTAIGEFLFLGKSRTSLEILRLAASLKTKEKLERKYKKYLTQFDEKYIESEHKESNKIWICWFQGLDEAPNIVKKCIESVEKNNPDKEIVIITTNNIHDYVA